MTMQLLMAGLFGLLSYLIVFKEWNYGAISLAILCSVGLFSQLERSALPFEIAMLLTIVLYIAALIDFKHYILPNVITLPLLLFGLLASYCKIGTVDLSQSLIGIAFAYILLAIPALIFKRLRGYHGLGGGDIKLTMALASWFGIDYLPVTLIFACCSALILFLFTPSSQRVIPFGPHLAFAGWLALINNPFIMGVYFNLSMWLL